MENNIKILHLEDNPNDSLLVQTLLKTPGVKFEYHFVDNEEDYISMLLNQNIDLILSDYHLPDYSGIEALRYAKNNFPEIPFVFLSGTMGEDVAVKSLLDGATDYVLKSNMERLVPSINRALKESQVLKARHKAETELVESEKRYRLLFDSNPMPMWVVEAFALDFLAVNEAAIFAYGYSREEFLKLRLIDLFCPEDKASFLLFDSSNQQKKRKIDKVRHLLKDGSIRIVEGISNRIFFEGKEARLVMINDVTERVQAEKDLLRSEENFRSSIAESPLGIRIITVNGDTIYGNKTLLDIYELGSMEEFINTPAKKRYTSESFLRHEERKAIRKSGRDVPEYELDIIRRNGAIRHLKVSRKEVLWNGIKHFLAIEIDITEQKNTELQLRKLSRAVEQSPDATVITNLEGIIEYVNPKAVKLTGYTADELIGRNSRIFSSGEKPKEEYSQLWETINSGNIWNGEFHNKKKNGELYWESATISPVLDNQGTITHFLAIKVDITATKKLLQDLNTAKEKAEESDRLKTAFLNNISHEIRTPFNGLLGFLSIIQDSDTSGNERDMYIGFINQSADRLMNTINDIVEISQIQTAQAQLTLSETNITILSNELYAGFNPEAQKKGLNFSINNSLSISTETVFTDSQKLKYILSNLISNALKFTKTGTIDFSIRPNEDWLEFSVKDTGIGIPENKHQTVFERFMQADVSNTRQFDGVGLGLSISKAYVEMLGGKIWLESQVGQGSEFFFTIPINNKQKATHDTKTPSPSKDKEEVSLKKQKILIVEDDELSEMLLKEIVKDQFEKRFYAKTGLEAIEICRNNPDIDLILMDIKMPGMDGYEATQQIRLFNKEVIIIAQTAYSMPGDQERALEAGCNDYIPKPYDRHSVMKIIKKALKFKS